MKYISSENDENMLRDINLSAELRQAEAEQKRPVESYFFLFRFFLTYL